MPPLPQKDIAWPTVRGTVKIRSFYTQDEIGALSFREMLIKYPRFHPLISKKESLMNAAQQPDANVTLATFDGCIIGFCFLRYPPPTERWVRVGKRIMMEVSAVEISRPWRSLGIAKSLLQLVTDHSLTEDRILYMVGYSWTWDLEGSGLKAIEYRNMLINLGSPFGFGVFQTNDPNILLRPENVFMARIGSHINDTVQKCFKMVRFGLK